MFEAALGYGEHDALVQTPQDPGVSVAEGATHAGLLEFSKLSFPLDWFGVPALFPSEWATPFLHFAITGACLVLLGVALMERTRDAELGAATLEESSVSSARDATA